MPTEQPVIETPQDTGPNIEAMSAEIAQDLFGQGSAPRAESAEIPAGNSGSAVETPSATADSGAEGQSTETTPEVQALGAPKTWTKEALAEWATIPPRVQQEIHKREGDFLNGITRYKADAELGTRYSQVIEPFRPILESENIDPVQMFQSFAANHYLLSRGTEAQKLELASNLISGYNIDFAKLIDYMGNRIPEVVDPRVATLEREVAQMRQEREASQRAQQSSALEAVNAEVETMAQSPEHPHFDKVVGEMAKLFETGQASTLQEAYEKAIWMNPETRKLAIEAENAKAVQARSEIDQARNRKVASATATDLSVDAKSRNGTVPVGSLDDTLAETLAAIRARG